MARTITALALCCAASMPLFAQQLTWYTAGNGDITGERIEVDPGGHTFLVGQHAAGADADPSSGVLTLADQGGHVSKFGPNGDFLWSVGFASTNSVAPMDVVVDPVGNIIVIGAFSGTADFDPSAAEYLVTASGAGDDGFMCVLSPNGTFQWAYTLPQAPCYRACGDAQGHVWITGTFNAPTDFDPGVDDHTLSPSGEATYLWKFDAYGSFTWAGMLSGTNGAPNIQGLATNNAGQLYIAGHYSGTVDFDPGAGTLMHSTALNASYGFVTKLDGNGNAQWQAQARIGDGMYDIAVDPMGAVVTSGYVVGDLGGADFDPGAGTYNIVFTENRPFIWKLNHAGELAWAKVFTDANNTDQVAIATDGDGNVIIGSEGSGDFDPGAGVTSVPAGYYIAALSAEGNFIWAGSMQAHTQWPTTGDKVWNICTDHEGNIHFGGMFAGTADLDPGPGTAMVVGDSISVGNENEPGSFYLVQLEPLYLIAGVPSAGAAASFVLYPTPVENTLNITSIQPILRIALYNAQGRKMRELPAAATSFDLSDLPSGAYLIDVLTTTGRATRPVMKK